MQAFTIEKGKAAPMMAANIDTDVIMPKQFLKRINREGLDKGVFYDHRFLANGELNPDFILNKPQWIGSKFLVVGPNFGCGSSREYAVWGMQQLGIRALIGTSFAGIFSDNCQRNGVLTITLPSDQVDELSKFASDADNNAIEVDLLNQRITYDDSKFLHFEIDPLVKSALVEGLDAIGSTMKRISQIEAFEKEHLEANPWLA
jgi:3-isopropylmalate/(R)-2-methylmalate dehydratase small subunit